MTTYHPPQSKISATSTARDVNGLGKSARVFAWPGCSNRHLNSYGAILHDALRRIGVEVRRCSLRRIRSIRQEIVHVHWPDHVSHRLFRRYDERDFFNPPALGLIGAVKNCSRGRQTSP